MKPTAANTSGCRGVTYDRKKGLWEAKIKFRGKSNRLGYFKRFGDAVAARKKAENTVFGEFLDSLEQNAGNRLFEKVRVLLGSEYISDMRSKRLLETTKRIVATIELTLYSVKDLADMAEYLYDRKMSDKDMAAVITYQKNAA